MDAGNGVAGFPHLQIHDLENLHRIRSFLASSPKPWPDVTIAPKGPAELELL